MSALTGMCVPLACPMYSAGFWRVFGGLIVQLAGRTFFDTTSQSRVRLNGPQRCSEGAGLTTLGLRAVGGVVEPPGAASGMATVPRPIAALRRRCSFAVTSRRRQAKKGARIVD